MLELMTKIFFSVIISFTESSTNNILIKQISVPNSWKKYCEVVKQQFF